MGTTAEKLQYTLNSVDDIQAALIEKGITVANTDPLGSYGDKIRSLTTGVNLYHVSTDISAGTWSGVTLGSDWVSLCTATKDSTWTYYFDKEIDVSKIQFISATFEPERYIRLIKGNDSSGKVNEYHFFTAYHVSGHKNGVSYDKISSTSSSCQVRLRIDNYAGYSSNSEIGDFVVSVYKDKIVFGFYYTDRGVGAIRGTNHKFSFNIGYL